jgi:lipid A 3-O-deacylase
MHRFLIAALTAAGLLPNLSAANAIAGPWSFTVRAENDLPVNSDRYYTNGVSFSFARCTDDRDALWPQVLRLPGLDRPGLLSTGFDFGQIMVTPADIGRAVPDPRDRPYAGLLFVSASWQRLADDHYAALKLITGVVGPESFAEQTQKTVHRTIGAALPRGWDHQLRTEPILNAVYERRWRVHSWGHTDRWNGDALLVDGAMLGNVLTQAYAQLQVRAGWRTPRDFGTSLIRGMGALPPARDAARWGAHAFAGIGALAVARNIALDGNTFRSGQGVGHRPFVPAAEAGVVVRGRGWQLTTSWVVWGREFDAQPAAAKFGTVAFTVFR